MRENMPLGWRTNRGPRDASQPHQATIIVKLFDRVLNPREIRRRLGLNQEQFWTQIGVTQSGGSRYESGREMPKPVRELLRLVHVEQIDLSQVKRVDFEIISYLKNSRGPLQEPAASGAARIAPRGQRSPRRGRHRRGALGRNRRARVPGGPVPSGSHSV
jgi:transcriptional regulator with XRE-family HTH domain